MKRILWLAATGLVVRILAQELSLPTAVIAPGDVEQASIRIHRFSSNACAVRFQYTEAGARKMLEFRKEHAGQKVRLQVGKFEAQTQLAPVGTGDVDATHSGWLQRRTDKLFCANEEEAKTITAGMTQ